MCTKVVALNIQNISLVKLDFNICGDICFKGGGNVLFVPQVFRRNARRVLVLVLEYWYWY